MIGRLKAIPIFAGFGEEVLEELAKIARARQCQEGETLFREGDAGDSVFIIESGAVEIRKKGRTLAVLGGGEIFGEMAFYENAPRSADAVAKAPSRLYVIGNEDFRHVILDHAREGVKFLLGNIQEMSRRLRTTSRYLITVFETGKMVGEGGADAGDLSRRILARLLEDVPDATGGWVMLLNPFTGTYDEGSRWKEPTLEFAEAEALIRDGDGGTLRRRDGARTLLGLPLKDEERVLGYIWLEKGGGDAFTTEEEIIASAVGNQVGLGIVNALHRQEERNRQRLEQGRMRRL
ncbi:MAG TPA: cyclic nucleotide-binding domain-containing protein [Verrucomicrobiae bacterium]|nr:cyclic nucleotide-binding domain-containing protein [Verrucomicrobiae bacterium]